MIKEYDPTRNPVQDKNKMEIEFPEPLQLIRQIDEHKWQLGVMKLIDNPNMKDCTVAKSYSATTGNVEWVYILSRTQKSNTYFQNIYYNSELISSKQM